MDIPLVNSDIHGRSSNGPFSLSKESSPNRFPRPFNDSTISNSQYQTLTNSALSPSRLPSSNDENDSFKVYVRIRPLNNKEQGSRNSKRRLTVTKTEDNMIFIFPPGTGVEAAYKQEKSYYFDKIFDSNSSTMEVYQRALTPAIQNVISGFNSTILAYGMTGAGKTFTMFGDIYNSMGGISTHPGIVSLVVRDLFQSFKKESENGFEFNIKLSYLEIYNEHARDLLTPGSEEMMIIEDSRRGIMIPNLTEFAINTHDEVVKHIVQGNSRRIMASTNANQFSSRSHAIIQFTVEKRSKTKDIVDSFLQSKLCLVDLAGSERAAVSDNKGLRQREGANINRSLLALGNCINILSDSNKKGAFVPYRDSKLTRLLKDSLGGNTRTVMLACISPSYIAYEETINTLKYASGARNIKRKIMRNIKEVQLHVSEYKGIIESLRVEVDALKHKLAEKNDQDIDQQGRQRNVPSSEYFNKVDSSLDELGKKLLNLFEENWEITQSVNDLKDLKIQNETTLRSKVTELENAVGDVALYNQITEEIASLKEVMANNDNIQMEMEASLEESLQEKKQIQAQILELIAQGVHNPQTMDNLNESQQIDKSLKLLEMEEDILSRSENAGMDTVDNSGLTASQGQKKNNKIHKLESEIEKMKRQLLAKDKLIAQNQQIIKTLCQSNSQKPENMPKLQTFTLKKQPSNPSPIRVKLSKNEFLIGPQDPYKFERGTGAFEPAPSSATKSSSKLRMKSPTSSSTTIAHALINLKSPERSQTFSNIPSTNTSITKGTSVSRKSRGEAPMSRDDSLKKPASSQQKDDKSRKQGHHKQGKSTNKQQQILETVSIEDLKNYAERLKKMSFEAAGLDKSHEDNNKHGYYKNYQNKKKRQEDVIAAKVQAVTYKIIDKLSPTKALPGHRPHHTQSQTNLASDYGLPVPTEAQSMVAPKAQSQQQIVSSSSQTNVNNGNSSPNLSSIGQSNEQSGDLSMKDILLENFSIDNKEKNYIRKELEKSSSLQDDKENLQTKETIDNNEIFDATKDSLTHSMSKNPLYRQLEELQKIECRSLASTDLNTLAQIKQIEGLGSPLSPSSKLRSPNETTNQLKSPGRGNLLANSKQYLQDDSVNKYSKLYEINKARRQAMKEKSPPFHEAMRMQKDEVQSPEIFRSPEKFEIMTSPTTENTVRGTYRMTENADVSASRELIKHEVRSLEARRGLLKEFRSKLHSYVTRVNNNLIHDDQYGEILSFLNDYRVNSQAYPISNADTLALEKLDLWTIEKAQQMEELNSARRMTNLNFQSIPQGDNISMINPTDFSRELYSEDRAKQDEIDRCFKAPESSRTIAEILDDENNKEKIQPKSGANTQVLDDMESEFDQEFGGNTTQSMQSMQDLVNNCEDIQPPHRENSHIIIKKPMDQSKGDYEEGEMIESSLVQEPSEPCKPIEMKNEVENKLEQQEKQESQAQEPKQVVSQQGTYFFIFLMGIAVLVLFNALFKSPIDVNGEF